MTSSYWTLKTIFILKFGKNPDLCSDIVLLLSTKNAFITLSPRSSLTASSTSTYLLFKTF